MEEVKLFLDKSNQWLTNIDLFNTLVKIGANECDVLYIHSAISFGMPNPELKKTQLLASILEVLKALKVKTMCMPTFTFSFCNKRDFDPTNSSSKMGLLNEFFRKQPDVTRSMDPLMSVAVWGADKDLATNIGHSSCGANSTFDMLRHKDNVKFLMLGAKIGDCMTFMHYLEWLYSVDYRYDRAFVGNVINNGIAQKVEYTLFCRYNGVTPNANSYVYENRMYDKSLAKIATFGDGTISIVDAHIAAEEYKKCLDEDPCFFVNLKDGILTKDKTYLTEGEVVAM